MNQQTLTEPELWRKLTEIFHEVFERDDIVLTPGLRCADIKGWDSFRLVQIVISAQETFAVKLTPDEIDSIRQVGDLARLVGRR
jgi:acyl carrier protein